MIWHRNVPNDAPTVGASPSPGGDGDRQWPGVLRTAHVAPVVANQPS